jgi:hypothetical protein
MLDSSLGGGLTGNSATKTAQRTHITAKILNVIFMVDALSVQSSATATGGLARNGTMTIEFHVSVKTEGAVAVRCSDLILPVKPFWFFDNMGNRAGSVTALPA